jgi:hypothetical protein
MPTPFTHLYGAQAALSDPLIPAEARRLLNDHAGAYLLGSVIADAHYLAKLRRDETHFYTYDQPITRTPWRVMLDQHPALRRTADDDQRAFLAGYAFHLTMDEVWTMDMLSVYFAHGAWGTRQQRFLMLHVLLIGMDERDLARIEARSVEALRDVQPGAWLPFLPQPVLRQWAEMIHRQIKPDGHSQTYEIIAPRVGMSPDQLRALMRDQARAEVELWANIPRATYAHIEARMFASAREQMLAYLQERR